MGHFIGSVSILGVVNVGVNTLNQHKNTTSFSKQSSIKVRSSNSVNTIDHPLTQPKTSIGHDTNCDIWINEDLVSGYHFQVEEQNGLYYIVHPHPLRAQTSNGFTYQGKQFQGHEKFKHLLKHGDVFRIGDAGEIIISITFDDGSGDLQDAPQIEDVYLHLSLIHI